MISLVNFCYGFVTGIQVRRLTEINKGCNEFLTFVGVKVQIRDSVLQFLRGIMEAAES
jgi:hypothetical protein